jgi:hypothetical protein
MLNINVSTKAISEYWGITTDRQTRKLAGFSLLIE